MEDELHFDASKPFEHKMQGRTADFAAPPTHDPFAARSMVNTTETALKSATTSIAGPLHVVPPENMEEVDDITLQHDEVGLNPIENMDALKKILDDQNLGCYDKALEKCLSSSMIPEELIERLLCRADKTFSICRTTDWMTKTTGYNLCGCDETVTLICDDDTKSLEGSNQNSFVMNDDNVSMNTASESQLICFLNFEKESQPNPALSSKIESKGKRIEIVLLNEIEVRDDRDESICDFVPADLPSQTDSIVTFKSDLERAANEKQGMIVSNNEESTIENSFENIVDEEILANTQSLINANDDQEKHNTQFISAEAEKIREKDNDENGFECVLQRKFKEDEHVTRRSPAKLTVATNGNAINQRVITPSPEKTFKYSSKAHLVKLSRKISFMRSTVTES